MEIIQFDLSGRGQPDLAETVYESLLGLLLPDCALPWVENIFVPGQPCYESYETMRTAYSRLLLRLEEIDEDPDAEEIIDALLTYSKIIGLEMFRYGTAYQKILDSTT